MEMDELEDLKKLARDFALQQICPHSLLPATVWEHNTVKQMATFGFFLLRLAIERGILSRPAETDTYTIEKMDIRDWVDSLPDPEAMP